MNKKKIKQFFRSSLGTVGLRLALFFVGVLSLDSIYKLSKALARITYAMSGKHRRIAQESLAIAFSQQFDSKKVKQIILGSFEENIKGALESLMMLKNPQVFSGRVSLSGKQHLEQALARGKGVICVTAHFGNFILLVIQLRALGFRTAVVMRPMRDAKLDNYLLDKRKALGMESIYTKPAKACVDQSLDFLRKNGIIFNLLDQNFGSDSGVFVDFFGTQAATATGPLVLALRSKAAIIPAFIIRKDDNSQEIIIDPEFQIEKQEHYQETVIHNIARLTKIIEGYIRKYPSQWSWIHRRWKSRPSTRT